jgi:hypothetical protein
VKTDSLIDLLATGAGPAPSHVVLRRLLPMAGLGVLVSAVLSLALFGPIPSSMYATPAPWIKLLYCGGLAAAAAWLVGRLAVPVARLTGPQRAVTAVVLGMAMLGAAVLAVAPASEHRELVLGHSWLKCPWTVALMAVPGLAGLLWALRGLAPTQPRRAGFAAGLMAGALSASGYALACTEVSPTFVSIWYTFGILLSAGLGAWLGPRVLRW